MSHFVKISRPVECSFTHNFNDKDWKALQELNGKPRGTARLSEGTATTDGKFVSITLKSTGGQRVYHLPVRELFK